MGGQALLLQFALFGLNHVYKKKVYTLAGTCHTPPTCTGRILTHPLILSGITLMMDPLLNNPLMVRIIRIQHLHRLPPPLTSPQIIPLERKTRNQHRQRQPLRVHPRLHELLLAREVRVTSYETEGNRHAGHPAAEDNGVALLRDPGFGALGGASFGVEGVELGFALVDVAGVGVAVALEVAGKAIGVCYGCWGMVVSECLIFSAERRSSSDSRLGSAHRRRLLCR